MQNSNHKDKVIKVKVTKWDIFFQLITIGLLVGVVPATTIIINYKEFSWLQAVLNFFILMVAFYGIHKLMVKKEIVKENTNEDE
ncbi:MAG: hypothetical protein WC102_10870 [Saccharofermentanales bacterium]